MILNSLLEPFNYDRHIGQDLLRVFIFSPKLLDIYKELILCLYELEKDI